MGTTGSINMQYESILDLTEQVKRARIVIGEENLVVEENYF